MKPSSPTPSPVPHARGSQPKAARPRRWPYVLGGFLILLLAAGLWPKPVAAEGETVIVAPLRVTVNDEGQTRVKHRYVIASPVGGQLRRIEHKAGAPVEAGRTPLARLETGGADLLDARSQAQAEARVSAAEAAREQATALAARADANAELARAERTRAEALFKTGGISRQELDLALMRDRAAAEDHRAATFGLQVAAHEAAQARALLLRGQDPAASEREPLVITSPINGRVLRVFQESQRLVPAGMPLMEVGDPTDLEVWVEVLSRDGVAIQPGATVWLEQWGGSAPLQAKVRLVEPSAWTKISALGVEEQRVWVIADFVDPVEKRPTLGDAYRVEAKIVLWEEQRVLQAPAGALFQREGQWYVYVVEGGKARLRTIKPGHSNGLATEILEGLKEGDTVLLYPGDKIRNGVRVSLL